MPDDLCLLKFVVANSLVFRDQQPSVTPNNRQPFIVRYTSSAIVIVQMTDVSDRVGFERVQDRPTVTKIFVEVEYEAITLPGAAPLPT